ncbi:MAG: glycosyltransferase family 4 protein [Verrucomicrobiota bacterium]
MRLLYFHQHFATPAGSSGTRSYEFARALVRRGHRVTVVCGAHALSGLDLPQDAAHGWARGTVDGIDVISLPLPYSNRDSLLRRAFVFMRFALRSARIALTEDVDLVFATSTPVSAAIPGLAAKWFRGIPFVFEVRDLWPDLPRALGVRNPFVLGLMTLLERLAYRSAAVVIGLAPGIVAAVRERSGVGLPVELIPNGCDLETFSPERRGPCRLPGVGPDDFVAGFTGAHGPANGLDAVLEAARELKRRGDRRVKLAFLGDGREKDRLAAIARAEGLDNCLFLPPVSKIALGDVTASFGCGLMVLRDVPEFRHGTSPNKFFDYLSAGVPVLNNYPGWVADLIEERRCGIVVPPGDSAAFADALQRLASDPATCAAMGTAARRLAEERFARDDLAEAFCVVLERAAL